MGHPHSELFCYDGFCGDTLFSCGHCTSDYHGFTFPGGWVKCGTKSEKGWHNATLPPYKEFCTPSCREAYMNAYNITKAKMDAKAKAKDAAKTTPV